MLAYSGVIPYLYMDGVPFLWSFSVIAVVWRKRDRPQAFSAHRPDLGQEARSLPNSSAQPNFFCISTVPEAMRPFRLSEIPNDGTCRIAKLIVSVYLPRSAASFDANETGFCRCTRQGSLSLLEINVRILRFA